MLADLTIADAETYSDGVPYEHFARLRRSAPVVWVREPPGPDFAGGPGFWAVTRHTDVAWVSRNPQLFSSYLGSAQLRDPPEKILLILRQVMLHMDPPEHTRMRKIISRAFTPRAVEELKQSIRRIAAEVVDAVAAKGQIDFVDDVAAEMPLLVLADVLGVPRSDRHLLRDWTDRVIGVDDPEYGGDQERFRSAFVEMAGYARERTEEKRAAPTDGVWSRAANAELDGERLTTKELDLFFALLVIAGNETTRNLIAGGMYALSLHPEQLNGLRADLELLPTAIDEMLRWWPPVIQFRRTATQDTELSGQPIKSGDKVVVFYPSANRDEDVFHDPDRFDITRQPNEHLSFGVGPHFCLGAHLARLEAKELFMELFTRLPDIEVTGPAQLLRSNFINGIRHLPARFTPRVVS